MGQEILDAKTPGSRNSTDSHLVVVAAAAGDVVDVAVVDDVVHDYCDDGDGEAGAVVAVLARSDVQTCVAAAGRRAVGGGSAVVPGRTR